VKKTVLLHLALLLAATVIALPMLWLICASFKTGSDLFDSVLLPWGHLNRLTLANFSDLFRREQFGRWLLNSLFVACTYTVCTVTLCSLGGFALAKYRFRGKRRISLLMLATLLLPSQVLLPGSYELMYKFGWIDSYLAILVPPAVSVLGTFLFRQAMLGVPDELLQCGRLDGCGELRLWWTIALPIVRPMIGAFTLLSFLSAWNSFLWPQIVLQSESKYTLPIALNNMLGLPDNQQQFGMIMAATLVSILPVVFLFFALQRDFVAGLASGAIKG
jgi:ABC-type glycerol-3-phosphate transport system permease component